MNSAFKPLSKNRQASKFRLFAPNIVFYYVLLRALDNPSKKIVVLTIFLFAFRSVYASCSAVALIAQLVEHLICNQGVGSSSLSGGTRPFSKKLNLNVIRILNRRFIDIVIRLLAVNAPVIYLLIRRFMCSFCS